MASCTVSDPIRLVRTTHSSDGTSVFASDSQITPFFPFGPSTTGFTILDERNSVPVTNTDDTPVFAERIPRTAPGGACFCVNNFPPGCKVPMHRTLSIDYCIVMKGEITLLLDGGDESTVKEGDVIVQQGVNHLWENRSREVCRVGFVCISAHHVEINGESLQETVIKAPPRT